MKPPPSKKLGKIVDTAARGQEYTSGLTSWATAKRW